MKKIKLLSVLGMVILLFAGCLSESDRAERVLHKHLKARYGEEFVIYGMGKRAGNVRRWYEAAVVYPKSYIGTRKENDSYYWGKGFVELNDGMKGGDTYGGVLLNESANEFYGKKLKELFGENYLAVLDVGGYYEYTDFEKEMNKRKKSYEKSPNGMFPPISGGIYIFGRVENDKDREWYRTQIYEFIQFMKETGTFEYVAIAINILDDRVLSKEFQENEDLKQKLVLTGEKNKRKNVEYFRKERNRLMNKLPKQLTPCIRMEDINKTAVINSVEWSCYNNLLTTGLYSEKYIKSENLEEFYKIKKYDDISDVIFTYEEY
ncbi:hypothetical protein LIY46_08255 [Fusobacterium varium]|uniref:hypothetical protein n=1 Tax=Fusobacterium TaxID=848 RepID=UPI0030D56535